MRSIDLKDRLSAANEARKAQLERAKAIAEDPERAERLRARAAVVQARNARIAERKAAEQALKERLAAEEAVGALPRRPREKPPAWRRKRPAPHERPSRQRRAEAQAADRDAILAARRAGRKARKRKGKR